MDQLWAPWRLPYIENSEPQPGCLFCRVRDQAQDEENLVLHRTRHCLIILNRYPYNSGHLMVVPLQHVGRLHELPLETGTEVFALAQWATVVLTEVMAPEGFNLGVNQGAVAGAGIADHIHLHVVPRWGGDTNFMPVLADAKVMPELLTATAAKLRRGFENVLLQ